MDLSESLSKLGEVYKYNAPTNLRAFALGLVNRDPNLVVTEKFLRPNDIKSLREAYRSSLYKYDYKKPNNIDYYNYPKTEQNFFMHSNKEGKRVGDNWMEMIAKSLLDPSYNMQTTIGRTQVPYTRNSKGEIIIRDTYDFPKGDVDKVNSGFDTLHKLGADRVTPYRWNINLGNPKDWK